MWSTQHSQITDVSIPALWRTFIAVHSGELTLPGGDHFEPERELAVGTRIAMTPAGQEQVISTVTETPFNGLILTFRHEFEPVKEGTRITHTLEITGDEANTIGAHIGPGISSDFPAQMSELIKAARAS